MSIFCGPPMRLANSLLALALPCFLSVVLCAAQSCAETRTVTANGAAAVQQSRAVARDQAINDALRRAVEQSVGLLVSSDTVVENSELVRDSIYTKTQGYISQYKISKETVAQELYLVTVQAEVAVGDLKSDLGALGLLQARAGRPRTLFLVTERHAGSEGPAASETALREDFAAKEFNVVAAPPGAAQAALQGQTEAELTDAAAREIGRTLGAELVVRCRAQVKESARNPGSPVGSYLADISAVALRVDSGQVLASGRGQGGARHVSRDIGENNALEQAGHQLSAKLIEQILARLTAETSGTRLTRVTLRGLSGLPDLVKFKEYLAAQVRGVQKVIQRSYQDGVAVLDVDARADAAQLGEELMLGKLPEYTLTVSRASASTLELAAVYPAAAPQIK